MAYIENKVIKKKVIDKDLKLKVTQNQMSGRLFVEFTSNDGKLVLQKSFQDTYHGNLDADAFQSSIKSINDLRNYFGLVVKKSKGEKNVAV